MDKAPKTVARRRWTIALAAALAVALALALAGCGSDAAADGAASGGAADAGDGGVGAVGGDASGGDGGAAADAAADAGADSGAPAVDPDATYAIGVRTIEITGAAGRKLPVEVWYPAEQTPGAEAATYALGLAPSPLGAVRDAAPLPGPWPLVVFSHGNGGIREQSVFVTEWLARHGFVVAAPEHVGNSFTSMDDKLTGAMVLWRPQDVARTVDALAVAGDGDQWRQGLVDTSKYAVMGHSFGGYTSLAVAGLDVKVPAKFPLGCDGANPPQPLCDEVKALGPQPWDLSDPRCVAAVPMAPAGYGWGLLAPPKAGEAVAPMLLMGATGDTVTPVATEAQAAYDDLQVPAALWVLKGGNHYTFSDICALEKVLPASLKQQLGAMCQPGVTPALAEVQADIADRALAAARLWLRGDKAAAAALVKAPPAWASVEGKNLP